MYKSHAEALWLISIALIFFLARPYFQLMRLLNKLNTTNFFLCSFPSDSIKPVFFFAGDAPGWVKLLLTISNSIFALFLCYQSWSVSREESQYYRYISPWPVRDLFVTLSDSPLLYLVKRYSTCGAAFLFGQECKRIYMESRGLKLGVLGQLGRNLSSSSPFPFFYFRLISLPFLDVMSFNTDITR